MLVLSFLHSSFCNGVLRSIRMKDIKNIYLMGANPSLPGFQENVIEVEVICECDIEGLEGGAGSSRLLVVYTGACTDCP